MNSRISMQIRQMQYDKPTRWVDSIQSVSTPLRLGMTLPDPFCWDAHTLCCETSVLPMHTDICLPLLVSYSFSAPPPPLFLWWGLLLHIHFNVHTSLQKSIAEPRYEGKPQQLAVYSCSLYNQGDHWQITTISGSDSPSLKTTLHPSQPTLNKVLIFRLYPILQVCSEFSWEGEQFNLLNSRGSKGNAVLLMVEVELLGKARPTLGFEI